MVGRWGGDQGGEGVKDDGEDKVLDGGVRAGLEERAGRT